MPNASKRKQAGALRTRLKKYILIKKIDVDLFRAKLNCINKIL